MTSKVIDPKKFEDLQLSCEGLKNTRLSIMEGWGENYDSFEEMRQLQDEALESYKTAIVEAAMALFED